MLRKIFDIERLIHSFKTALACVIGILIIKLGHFQTGQWIMISIIIVMCAQINVGGVMQKSFLRLMGTLFGCIIAVLALVGFGDTETVVFITIALSSFLFSYIATANDKFIYFGTLGAATAAIILINKNPTISLAADRFLEISIGILIAALVSQLVLPIHARTHLLREQAKTLQLLRDFYLASVASPPINAPIEFQENDEDIVKTISKQRQLSKEAAREPLGLFFDRHHFAQTLLCEKEILRAINFMHTALFQLKQYPNLFTRLTALKYLNDTIPKAFEALIHVMENEDVSEIRFELPTFANLKASMDEMYLQCPRDEALYLDGLLFSAEKLIDRLTKLAALFNITIYEAPYKTTKTTE